MALDWPNSIALQGTASAPCKVNKIQTILCRRENHTLENDVPCFLERSPLQAASTERGVKGWLQRILKRHGKLYYTLVAVAGPTWHDARLRRRRRGLLDGYDQRHVVLNLGSGPAYYLNRRDIINVDLFPFQEVDIVADANDLPIHADCADLIINVAMLEHTPDPAHVVDEMFRVLKPGGRILCFVPFMAPYHAAPHDYHRWTSSGARVLFAQFTDVEIHVSPGPTSSLLWVLQEWLATLLSLGSKAVHDCVLLLLMSLSFPIKFLDEILTRMPNAYGTALGFYVIARK